MRYAQAFKAFARRAKKQRRDRFIVQRRKTLRARAPLCTDLEV